jgi:hypothetical protein
MRHHALSEPIREPHLLENDDLGHTDVEPAIR